MPKVMLDSTADKFIFYALLAWAASCVHPAIGLMLQFPAIIYLVKRCNMKSLPALLILMLGKGNVRIFGGAAEFALRFGITLTPTSLFAICAFVFAVLGVLRNKYDSGAKMFAVFWLLTAIPAFVISFQAKRYGLKGAWSVPIMTFLVPGVYYWGLSMAKTYDEGRDYFVKRIFFILLAFEVLYLGQIIYVFTFFHGTLLLCMAIYVLRDNQRKWGGLKALTPLSILVVFAVMLFARRIKLDAVIASDYYAKDLASGDKFGGTFSGMANMAVTFFLAMFGKALPKGMLRMLPILMAVFNISFVSFAITTQSGNKAHDVDFRYETFAERFETKLFADRATVWKMGWDEIKTPPYVFKDMRQVYVYGLDGKQGMKLLPHNQFLTLLARSGLWLGGVLSLFIIWVWVRACKAMTFCMDDLLISTVFVPVGISIYFIGGLAGQAVVTHNLWDHSTVCLIFPAIIYGHWLDRRRRGSFMPIRNW